MNNEFESWLKDVRIIFQSLTPSEAEKKKAIEILFSLMCSFVICIATWNYLKWDFRRKHNRSVKNRQKMKHENKTEDVKDIKNGNTSKSKKSAYEDSVCAEIDSLKIKAHKPQLPYDPQVDTFGDRILKIDSTEMTYEQAYEIPEYVDRALDLDNSSDSGLPIEFTQFVLRKMAVDEIHCCTFMKALNPKAEQYLSKLVYPENSEMRQVHEANLDERPSLFRSLFLKLFCRKVITNLQNANHERGRFIKLARVFPFPVQKNVPEYKGKINVMNQFDNRFYTRMQNFLDEHFDIKVPARETIALFMNNIRHFLKTNSTAEYLSTFPRLNDTGVQHFQYLYREYGKVREQFYHYCDDLGVTNEDLRKIPEKNFEQLASLLLSIEFRTDPEMYLETFEKYLFFFVHVLQVEEAETSVFFIDDMIYQCLKSLRRFRTLREDIIIDKDIAMMTLLWELGPLGHNLGVYSYNDRFAINSKTLRNIKEYLSNFISDKNKVQFPHRFKTDVLFCELHFRVDNTVCFNVCYASKTNNCERGIMKFLHQLICSALSPDDDPIETIVCYSAYLGQENRFEIPRDVIESVRNFVRLSTKKEIDASMEEANNKIEKNKFLELLKGRYLTFSNV